MKEESMNLLCAVFLGLIAAASGLVWNKNWQFLANSTSQSRISQAYAAETIQMDATAAELIQLGKQQPNLMQQPNSMKIERRKSDQSLTLKSFVRGYTYHSRI